MIVITHFSGTIGRRSQRLYLLFTYCKELLAQFAFYISTQFHISRSHNGTGRSISISFRNIGSIKVPIRDFIFRQTRVVHNVLTDFYSMVQILFLTRLTIHHGESIQSPCLSTRPGGLVVYPLMCHLVQHLSCNRIIANHMVRTAIRTEMIDHCTVGMRFCFIIVRIISRHG